MQNIQKLLIIFVGEMSELRRILLFQFLLGETVPKKNLQGLHMLRRCCWTRAHIESKELNADKTEVQGAFAPFFRRLLQTVFRINFSKDTE